MDAIVAAALRQRVLVLIFFVIMMVAGVAAFRALNIEAYPDPTPPMVDVVTQSQGLSAEEVERYITIPIEVATAGLPNFKVVRTISLFGLSDVKLQFDFRFTYEEAKQQVLNQLSQLTGLPSGAQPTISPVSPIGEIFRYRLAGPADYSVMDLKTLQDWVLQRRFKSVPGVIDVTGWGGKTKTFEISVDLDRLVAYGLTLPQLLTALNNANVNVGGNTVNIGGQSAVIRGVGLIRTMDDIADTMLTQAGGSPVLVRDVATVIVGNQPRLGIAGQDESDDIVQGTVLMRRGERSSPTITAVVAEVDRVNSSGLLPPGVRIERVYDRKDLIDVTTATVLHNMVVGILLILVIQWLFLGNLRSALIVAATIPFALFFAVGILVLRGESANLLSVGAIDFGLIVDSTVIMVEAIFRHLSGHGPEANADEPIPVAPAGLVGRLGGIYLASSTVSRAILFSAAIIIAGFLPLFTLSGVEGHIFGPMAKTYAYALAGGLLATFTVTPALCAVVLPKHVSEAETLLVRAMAALYMPAVRFALANRILALGIAAVILVGSGLAVRSLGLEFLPKLEEGNLWIRATMPSTISLEEGNVYANGMRRVIKSFPEVETVISQHGRPDDGTDAAGFFNAEFFAPLKPPAEWRKGVEKDDLVDQVLSRLKEAYPGVEFNFSQYLQDNVAEAVSGVKGENSIKLFGNDLQVLSDTADRIKAVLSTIQGVADLAVLTSLGQPTVQIDIDRARAARYGLSPGDINSTVRTAIGGESAGDLYEPGSDRHFPIIVRLAPKYRQSAEAIRNITVGVQSGGSLTQIPLSLVATVKLVSGASYIYREQQQRYLPVKFSVRDRDLGSVILEAQQRIAAEVPLPPGYRTEFVGEFENLRGAIERLSIVVPIALALIALLLYLNFGSLTDTLLGLSVIPLALAGGIFALFSLGIAFSVSAAIGFIALFGIAVMDGIIIITHFNDLIDRGRERMEAVIETCETQMRPVVMTCVVAGVGLLPAAFSSGIGSQVQKPLAVVVVGGMALAPILILMILPVLISLFSRHGRAAEGTPAPPLATAVAMPEPAE